MDRTKTAMIVGIVLLIVIGLPFCYGVGRHSVLLQMRGNFERFGSASSQYSPPPAIIPPFSRNVPTPSEAITGPPISEAAFQQIQPGMTWEQVVQVLGRPGTLSHQSHSKHTDGSPYNLDTYKWEWNTGKFMRSSITIQFQNGYVDHTNYMN